MPLPTDNEGAATEIAYKGGRLALCSNGAHEILARASVAEIMSIHHRAMYIHSGVKHDARYANYWTDESETWDKLMKTASSTTGAAAKSTGTSEKIVDPATAQTADTAGAGTGSAAFTIGQRATPQRLTGAWATYNGITGVIVEWLPIKSKFVILLDEELDTDPTGPARRGLQITVPPAYLVLTDEHNPWIRKIELPVETTGFGLCGTGTIGEIALPVDDVINTFASMVDWDNLTPERWLRILYRTPATFDSLKQEHIEWVTTKAKQRVAQGGDLLEYLRSLLENFRTSAPCRPLCRQG